MLDSKVILITGASKGIGRSVAAALAAQGATLILLARTAVELQLLADEIVNSGARQPKVCLFNLCSATLEDYDDLRIQISEQYGRLDGLIHNAGILGTLSPLEHYNIQTWYQVLQVNLNSAFILTQATLPLLKLSAAGSIIFTLTDLCDQPKANWGAYAVASSGCKTMMQMLAQECANTSKIRVNAVRPFKVNTKLRAQAYPAEDKELLNQSADMVKSYIYLMSDDSQHLNAEILDLKTDEVCIVD